MWVKICANTNLQDALHAARTGADAIGFVFAASSRQVQAEQVAEIAAQLPKAVERIGVFAGWDAALIAQTARIARLTGVQLHDAHDAARLHAVRQALDPDILLLPVVHWLVDSPKAASLAVQALSELQHEGFDRVLLDAKQGGRSGGLGVRFDWAEARTVFAQFPQLKLVLAGGLTPDNVGQAIATVKPWGVDVASGVEARPGSKDPDKVQQMVTAVRNEAGHKKT